MNEDRKRQSVDIAAEIFSQMTDADVADFTIEGWTDGVSAMLVHKDGWEGPEPMARGVSI